jgi:hypothetical protein
MFKHNARKPDFELTKPSTIQEYNDNNNRKEKRNGLLGIPAYRATQEAT